MIERLFFYILIASAVGTMLGTVLLCFEPISRRIFSPTWQYCLWIAVLAVMLLPQPLCITRFAPDTPVQQVYEKTEIIRGSVLKYEPQKSVQPHIMPKIRQAASVVWLTAAVLIFSVKAVKYVIFRKTVYRHSQKCAACENIPKRLDVRCTKMLDSPILIGFIKPILILPEDALGSDSLGLLLAHELTHYRRHDTVFKWLAALAASVHWFNPFVYIFRKKADEACEVSCDCAVMRGLAAQEQARYMRLILDMLEHSFVQRNAQAVGISGSKRTMLRRIQLIGNRRLIHMPITAFSVVFGIFLLSTSVFAGGVLRGTVFPKRKAPTEIFKSVTAASDSLIKPSDSTNNRVNTAHSENNSTNAAHSDAENTADLPPLPENSNAETPANTEISAVNNAEVSAAEPLPVSETDSAEDIPRHVNGITNTLSYTNGCASSVRSIRCDSSGNIAVMFNLNAESIVELSFYDSQSAAFISAVRVPAAGNTVNVFDGFDPDTAYDITLKCPTGSDWKIEGSYTVL